MTREEVLKKIEDARLAIREYSSKGMEKTAMASEQAQVQLIKRSSIMLISEARSIGAAGQQCPACQGTGRL